MLPEVNLLPEYERQSSVLPIVLITFTIIILLGYLLFGFYYFKTKNNLQALETTYSQVSGEVDILRLQSEKLATEQTPMIEQAVAFVENYNIPTSEFIVEINDLLPEHGYLEEYVYENEVARPVVHLETLDAVANYTTALLTSEFIRDTKVDRAEAFTYRNEGLTETEDDFDKIPRYRADFTLEINKAKLKGDN